MIKLYGNSFGKEETYYYLATMYEEEIIINDIRIRIKPMKIYSVDISSKKEIEINILNNKSQLFMFEINKK
ncbi:hypothetical protein [Haliovirga abyssi]|uniref:Uncharacterized protein n=1 Tax=Haliovirga abyssi TaxID=2996794 RepID=A0AAU9DL15_9FUSO|nr:hypothetical protein [Haliovirga abyssi]BDU51599.1 hypothetical protein HLVA_21680 [Haliovirga abyssi]